MVKPILGGPGPTIKLFHYGGAIQGVVSKGGYWTPFDSGNREDVSRLTGRVAMDLRFKNMVLVNRSKLNFHFDNMATSSKPGLGYDEYRNKVDISSSYLESTPMP